MALPYSQLKLQGNWAMKIQGIISLCPTGIIPPVPPPTGSVLTGFSVTTTAGNTLVSWGDNTSETIGSGNSTNHTFLCPDANIGTGFWSNVTVCA